jgi:hypothetical protein
MSELTRFHTATKAIQSCTYLPSLEAIHLRVRKVRTDSNPEAAR